MSVFRPEEYTEHTEDVPPFTIRIVSYKLGNVYHSVADNVDPGAVIARTTGTTLQEAEAKVRERARSRMAHPATRGREL